jgi:CDP-2,3-bis-(O-geranylgeranyl)-sn-glycerol synthase
VLAAPFSRVDYTHWPLLGLGFGVGAMLGDSLKSLLKRRLRIAPGAPWIPFDQVDFVLGALALVGPAAGLSWLEVIVILAVTFFGELAANRIAFRLGVKDTPW